MLRQPNSSGAEMNDVREIDLLFRTVLGRFYAIPARQPALGRTTFAQMRVLWTLQREGSATLSVVARALGVTRSTATELVDRLVGDGRVRRERSLRDRREVLLTLRPAGLRLLDDFAERRRDRVRKLLHGMGRDDVTRLSGALRTLSDVVGRWGGKKS